MTRRLLALALLATLAPAAPAQTIRGGGTVAASDRVSDDAGRMAYGVISGDVAGFARTSNAQVNPAELFRPPPTDSDAASAAGPGGFGGGGGGGCDLAATGSGGGSLLGVLVGLLLVASRRRWRGGPERCPRRPSSTRC